MATTEEILAFIKEAVSNHESDGYTQWYVDEFCIDCDAAVFWGVVEEAVRAAIAEEVNK